MDSGKVAREFWILLSDFGQHLWKPHTKIEAHAGWRRVESGETFKFGDGIHVIEKSAYDALKTERDGYSYTNKVQAETIGELKRDLRMVLASQERQRQLNDAQSVKLESAREVIHSMADDIEHYYENQCLPTKDEYERAREWMKSNGT